MEPSMALANYGAVGVFALLFWRFIVNTQQKQEEMMKEQSKTLKELSDSVSRLADKVENSG